MGRRRPTPPSTTPAASPTASRARPGRSAAASICVEGVCCNSACTGTCESCVCRPARSLRAGPRRHGSPDAVWPAPPNPGAGARRRLERRRPRRRRHPAARRRLHGLEPAVRRHLQRQPRLPLSRDREGLREPLVQRLRRGGGHDLRWPGQLRPHPERLRGLRLRRRRLQHPLRRPRGLPEGKDLLQRRQPVRAQEGRRPRLRHRRRVPQRPLRGRCLLQQRLRRALHLHRDAGQVQVPGGHLRPRRGLPGLLPGRRRRWRGRQVRHLAQRGCAGRLRRCAAHGLREVGDRLRRRRRQRQARPGRLLRRCQQVQGDLRLRLRRQDRQGAARDPRLGLQVLQGRRDPVQLRHADLDLRQRRPDRRADLFGSM